MKDNRVSILDEKARLHYKEFEDAVADELYYTLPRYLRDQVDIDSELADEEEL